jgi:hypothetical protein
MFIIVVDNLERKQKYLVDMIFFQTKKTENLVYIRTKENVVYGIRENTGVFFKQIIQGKKLGKCTLYLHHTKYMYIYIYIYKQNFFSDNYSFFENNIYVYLKTLTIRRNRQTACERILRSIGKRKRNYIDRT